jgi:hypothetical protein
MATRRRTPALWATLFDAYWAREGALPKNWTKVPARERMALAIGLFHTQMGRNGAELWITNGFSSECGSEVLRQLKKLGLPPAMEAAVIVEEIRKLEKTIWLAEAGTLPEHDAELDAASQRCVALDKQYDKVEVRLMRDLDMWLAAG